MILLDIKFFLQSYNMFLGKKKTDLDYDYEEYFHGTKNILGDNDMYKSGII